MPSVNGDDHFTFYNVATDLAENKSECSIIDSGAGAIFVTNDSYLTKAITHKKFIAMANSKDSFEKSQGKYKVTETSHHIYLSALLAPDSTNNLISVGQLAMKHNVLFAKEGVT